MKPVTPISESPKVNSYDKVYEFPAGFLLAPRPQGTGAIPTFQWDLHVKVGKGGDQDCNKITVGSAQNLLSYGATATWESGTTWVWSAPKTPARDADTNTGKPPWYSTELTFLAENCGQAIAVKHIDSPTLGAQAKDITGYRPPSQEDRGLVPWDDPLTKAKNSIRSLDWHAEFEAFIIAYDGHDVQVVRRRGWSLTVNVVFHMDRPVGSRGSIAHADNVLLIAAKGTKPITKGKQASIKLRQFKSLTDALRAK